jgi:hypothetical protein
MIMKSRVLSAAALLMWVSAGCVSSSSSNRRADRSDYADAIFGVATPLPPAGAPTTDPADAPSVPGPAASTTAAPAMIEPSAPVRLRLPARAAVIEIGEVAPPAAMVRRYRERSDLFADVEPLTDLGDTCDSTPKISPKSLEAIRKAAGGMGLDYVLIYGGTVQTARMATPLEVFNWTILGAWIVPSIQLTATGRSAGALIDVRTGRIVFTVSDDASAGTLQPTASASGADEPLRAGVKEKLNTLMAEATIGRMAAEKK